MDGSLCSQRVFAVPTVRQMEMPLGWEGTAPAAVVIREGEGRMGVTQAPSGPWRSPCCGARPVLGPRGRS